MRISGNDGHQMSRSNQFRFYANKLQTFIGLGSFGGSPSEYVQNNYG